jgi:hypothetical protein
MGFFKHKADPVTERARALTEQIAALEEQIQQLSAQEGRAAGTGRAHPRLRSTARPNRQALATPPPVEPEAAFEEVNQRRLKSPPEPATPEHYNELGVRKYDLVAAWRRWSNNFRGPATSNPKLVSYLAAGSIQGLRPMRYEKRIARNRFLVLVIILVLGLLGILSALTRH